MLKFPKLLRKQYLNHSPIWKAYINGGKVPQQCFMINAKLFSAYCLSEALNKSNSKKQMDKIIAELDKYRKMVEENKKQERNQSLEKVYKFISAYSSRQLKDANLAKDIYQIYKNIYAQTEQQTKGDTKEPYIHLYLKLLSRVSSHQSMDDIDLLMMQGLQIGTPQLALLQRIKLEWGIQNRVTASVFKKMILKQLCRRNFTKISLLKRYLNKLKQNIDQQCAQKKNQPLNILLKCLQNIISSGNTMQDIDKQSIYLLLNLDISILDEFGFTCYLQVLSYQYTMLLDWLVVKSLYRSSRSSFVSNLDEFCSKFKYMNLPKIAQIRMSKNKSKGGKAEEEKIIKIYQQQEIRKLEIITFIYDAIMKCASASMETKKVDQNKRYIQQNLQKVADLRELKIEQEKLVSRMYTNKSNNRNIIQQNQKNSKFNEMIAHLQSIQKIRHLINAGISSTDRIRVTSPAIRELAITFIEQIVKYDVILLNKSQIVTVSNVINEVGDLIKNSRIRQYQKKLNKYLQNKENIGKRIQNQFESAGSAKIMWMSLIKQRGNYENKQLVDFVNSIFLLSGQQLRKRKQERKKAEESKQMDAETSKNRYMQQMKQLFE